MVVSHYFYTVRVPCSIILTVLCLGWTESRNKVQCSQQYWRWRGSACKVVGWRMVLQMSSKQLS